MKDKLAKTIDGKEIMVPGIRSRAMNLVCNDFWGMAGILMMGTLFSFFFGMLLSGMVDTVFSIFIAGPVTLAYTKVITALGLVPFMFVVSRCIVKNCQ